MKVNFINHLRLMIAVRLTTSSILWTRHYSQKVINGGNSNTVLTFCSEF